MQQPLIPQPVNPPAEWSPRSWRERPALQMPTYPDATALETALDELRQLPPLVTSWEIFALKRQLAEAQEGKRFLLQGGGLRRELRRVRLQHHIQPASRCCCR